MAEPGIGSGSGRIEIVVHVGDGKTGTSAIQRMLREHPSQLSADGVRYLGLMFESAPVSLHPWQKPEMIEAFHRLPPDQAVAELGALLSACVHAAEHSGLRRLVWSNETLLGRSGPTIRALQSVADRADVTIVAYVRRHDRLANSAYLQWGLKHKTYDGPLRDFAGWTARRKLALAPKLQPWLDAFGPAVRLRNYDAADDVTRDFLHAMGVDPAPYGTARRNLPLSAAELALRSVFNAMSDGRVSPNRFTTLFGTRRVDFSLPLRDWMTCLLPDEAALEQVRETMASDAKAVDAMLTAAGQPPFDRTPMEVAPFDLDPDTLVVALMQMLAVQAERVESLEQRLQSLERPGPAPEVASVRGPQGRWPDAMPQGAVQQALAPALGYFGAHAADCLERPVAGPVDGLRLALEESKPVFLNLRGLELLKGGKPVALQAHTPRCTQSSVADDDARNGADKLLSNKGIHSKAETAPWWEVEFGLPVDCDSIRVWNRSDGWGSRSRTLRIEVRSGDLGQHVHDGQSREQLLEVLDALAAAAGAPPLATWPATAAAARRWREDLLAEVATRVASGDIALAAIPWRALLQAVDAWGREGEPTDATWTMIAAFLLHQHTGKGGTSIKAFSLLLGSRERLVRLQHELNELAGRLGLGRYMLTRHGVKSEGVLRCEPEKFVAHMRAVVEALDSLGREPVMAYGTLLGAVRDGDFIAHDDDIDLLCRSAADSRAGTEQDVLQLKDALRDKGFRVVDLLPNSLNLHVIDPKNGAVMDVFPCWRQDGALHMHMESMKVRGIPEDAIYPRTSIEFRGSRFPAPARPEEFLRERYGEGWRTSDQFYEWPWPLEEKTS